MDLTNEPSHGGAPLPETALEELRFAKGLVEAPHLAARLSSVVGSGLDALLEKLGEKHAAKIHDLTSKALDKAFSAALKTLDTSKSPEARPKLHMAAATAAGAAGGAFGWTALAIELPITTGVILRSIADIARAEGESLDRPESRLQCLQVFALGGSSTADDGAESGYFAIRSAMTGAVSQAAVYLASEAAVTGRSAPALVKVMAAIAERFSVQVTAKVAATAVPVIGAVTGAAVNSIFMDHFQSVARGHFIIRRLERDYGLPAVYRGVEQLNARQS